MSEHIPVGVDAETVAEIARPGDLWVRSNDFRWEHIENADGRGGYPPHPSDRLSSWSRRLVGPFRKVDRIAVALTSTHTPRETAS